jgi:uncharacterized protein (TIGR02453 family)
VEFFRGLEADNTKAYWSAHKGLYEASVREPMADLLSELSGEFGPGRIARPYRDVRFRADKSPYKTQIYAIFDRGGYVNFSAGGLTAGAGYFRMSTVQLERYRNAVGRETDGAQLVTLVEQLRGEGLEVGGGQVLKSAPRGYPQDHPRIELLRYKGLICWHHWPVAAWLHTAAAKDKVAGFLRTTAPLHHWLEHHVGPDQT